MRGVIFKKHTAREAQVYTHKVLRVTIFQAYYFSSPMGFECQENEQIPDGITSNYICICIFFWPLQKFCLVGRRRIFINICV